MNKNKLSYLVTFLLFFLFTTLFGLIFNNIWIQIDKFISVASSVITILGIFIPYPVVNVKVKCNIVVATMGVIIAAIIIPFCYNIIANNSGANQDSVIHIKGSGDYYDIKIELNSSNDNIELNIGAIDNEDYTNNSLGNEESNDILVSDSKPSNDDNFEESTIDNQDMLYHDPLSPDAITLIIPEDIFIPVNGSNSLFYAIDNQLILTIPNIIGENKETIKYNIEYSLKTQINTHKQTA